MRADRLLSILMLLQLEGRVTARALAERLEVSERTIQRDMEALCAAGVPLIAERGVGGGWSLPETYQTDLTGLTEGEIQALFLTKPARLLDDLGLRQAAEGARLKLLAALPAVSRHNAEYARQRILVDPTGWGSRNEEAVFLPVVQEAVWQDRKLRLAYARSDSTTVERIVDPLGLVAKGSVWYLVAAMEGTPRTYRISRVSHAELDDAMCERPLDFDLATYWQQSFVEFKANLPRYPVLLRADLEVLPRLRQARYARVEAVSPVEADGWVVVHALFEVEEDAADYLLGLGSRVVVLEPPALRSRVIALAESVLAHYAEDRPMRSEKGGDAREATGATS